MSSTMLIIERAVLVLFMLIFVADGQPRAKDLFQQISLDLYEFRKGVTLDMVEQAYCSNRDQGFRLQIVDSKLYIVGEILGSLSKQRNRNIKMQILAAAQQQGLPDLDLYITTDDWPQKQQVNVSQACPVQGPVFAQAKRDTRPHVVLIPDHTFYDWSQDHSPGWPALQPILSSTAKQAPWHTRIPKLFFRGSNNTGLRGFITGMDLGVYDELDMKVWHWVKDKTRQSFVSFVDHCQYKYLLNWPGHSYSARLKALLQCGAAVIYPSNGWYEFYYHMLQHGENIIIMPPLGEPRHVTHNLTGLVKILGQHDRRAEKLGQAAQLMAETILSPSNVRQYWVQLLTDYAKLMKFKPTLHPDAISMARSLTVAWPESYHLTNRTCTLCGHNPSHGDRWDWDW